MRHQRVFRRIAEDDGWGEGVEVESEAEQKNNYEGKIMKDEFFGHGISLHEKR